MAPPPFCESPLTDSAHQVVGNAQFAVHSNGTWSLSYYFTNNSEFNKGVYYTLALSLISPTGTAFVFQHAYELYSADKGTITGTDARIAADWQDLQGCQIEPSVYTGLNPPVAQGLVNEASNVLGTQGLISQAFVCTGGNGDTQLSVP